MRSLPLLLLLVWGCSSVRLGGRARAPHELDELPLRFCLLGSGAARGQDPDRLRAQFAKRAPYTSLPVVQEATPGECELWVYLVPDRPETATVYSGVSGSRLGEFHALRLRYETPWANVGRVIYDSFRPGTPRYAGLRAAQAGAAALRKVEESGSQAEAAGERERAMRLACDAVRGAWNDSYPAARLRRACLRLAAALGAPPVPERAVGCAPRATAFLKHAEDAEQVRARIRELEVEAELSLRGGP